MAAANVKLRQETRVVPGLPSGMTQWWFAGSVQGDAVGTTLAVNCVINANTQTSYTKYWVVDTMWTRVRTNPNQPWVMAYTGGGTWERTAPEMPAAQLPIYSPIEMLDEPLGGTGRSVTVSRPVHLGKILAGTLATITIQTENQNGMIFDAYMSGWVADYPMWARDTVRA